MKVLLVGATESPHLQRWATALADSGATVACAGFVALDDVGFETVVLPSGDGGDARYVRALPALRRFVRRFRPDVIHAHFVSSYGLMAFLASSGRPVIQFAWGTDLMAPEELHRAQWRLVAVALRRAAGVVVDSADVGVIVEQRARREPLRVTFGPPESWTTATRAPAHSILSPRGLLAKYNPEDVVAAFAAAASDLDGWRLDMLTAGGDASVLAADFARRGLDDRVNWWPFLSRAELQERYLEAEIMCSVPPRDATSVCLLEAMASGAFPIVSDLPANRELIVDGENGLVVPAGDVQALAAAFVRAAGDTELRARASTTNRELVARTATWERAVEAVLALTESVIR